MLASHLKSEIRGAILSKWRERGRNKSPRENAHGLRGSLSHRVRGFLGCKKVKSRARRRFILAVCRNDVRDMWILPQRGVLTLREEEKPFSRVGSGRVAKSWNGESMRCSATGKRNVGKFAEAGKSKQEKGAKSLSWHSYYFRRSRAFPRVILAFPRDGAVASWHPRFTVNWFLVISHRGDVRRNDREDKMCGHKK